MMYCIYWDSEVCNQRTICFPKKPQELRSLEPLKCCLGPVCKQWRCGGGWRRARETHRPDHPVTIRDRPSASLCADPARCWPLKWYSWSAKNHLVTGALESLARAIHCKGAWSVTKVSISTAGFHGFLFHCSITGLSRGELAARQWDTLLLPGLGTALLLLLRQMRLSVR